MRYVLTNRTDFRGAASRYQKSRADLLGWARKALDEAFDEESRSSQTSLFIRETELEHEIPFQAFDSAIDDVRFFASEGGPMTLGIGIAREWAANPEGSFGDRRQTISLSPAPQQSAVPLLGGWSFPTGDAPKRGGRVWSGFPASSWAIPAITFVSLNGRTRVILAAFLDGSKPPSKILKYYERLVNAASGTAYRSYPCLVRVRSQPSRNKWLSMARHALEFISEGKLNKVVLARALSTWFDGDIPPSIVLKRLLQSNPDSTVFAIKKGEATLLGASPEHLLSLKERDARVDCLAATAARSSDPATDELLGSNLMHDEKSRREHLLVVRGVMDSLSSICSNVRVQGRIRLRKLATVQHLLTTVNGRLGPGVDIWSAGLSLWPTPATGGEPKNASLKWIQDFEPFVRGWYSGVVGRVNTSGDGELVVAIRSGIIRRKTAVIFAGAGLVSGSSPDKEFEETGWKMKTMMEALGVPRGE